MGTDNGGTIQYGYNFERLNTFEMGHLKKTCSHIPSRMDLSQTPGRLTKRNLKPIHGIGTEKTTFKNNCQNLHFFYLFFLYFSLIRGYNGTSLIPCSSLGSHLSFDVLCIKIEHIIIEISTKM